MTIEDIKKLIAEDEHRTLELKKSTGELKEGMKSACAFLNTEGGYLIFGITPTSLKITGQYVTDNTQREIAQELAKIEPGIDARAEFIEVPDSDGQQLIVYHFDAWKDGQVPYTYNGCPYYRIESTTKVMPRDMYNERLRRSNPEKFAWDSQIADGITIADLNEDRIRGAVRLGVAGGRINASAEGDKVETLLTKFKLLNNDKPTNAAVVLFGDNVDDYPQLLLRMARFRGTDKMEFIDNRRATGNFFDLLDAGIDFCFKHMNLSGKIVGLRREEHLDIPVEALREALTNSFCHRRYDDPRASVSLAIYDDRVEIVNPGCFTNGLTPENIKESHESFPYNHLIAQVLYLSTYLESWGTGVRRMIDLCREQGLPEPEYQSDGYTVKIVFWKKDKKDVPNDPNNVPDGGGNSGGNNVSSDVSSLSVAQLSERQKKIYELIKNDSYISGERMSVVLSVAPRTIWRDLAAMQKKGIILHEGNTSSGHWKILIDNFE